MWTMSLGTQETNRATWGYWEIFPSKCKIGFAKVDFLGHTIQKDTINPQIEIVRRILDTDCPKTKKACRSLLGIINFYRRYIPDCVKIIAPITELTKARASNEVKWEVCRKGLSGRSNRFSVRNQFWSYQTLTGSLSCRQMHQT